jgi:hypothetical protein
MPSGTAEVNLLSSRIEVLKKNTEIQEMVEKIVGKLPFFLYLARERVLGRCARSESDAAGQLAEAASEMRQDK